MAKKKLVPLSVKGADLELTQKQKQKYALARQNNDFVGMRLANVEANRLREKANLPLYSSAIGDKQHSLNTVKKVGNLKPYLGAQHIAPPIKENNRQPYLPKVLNHAKENLISNFTTNPFDKTENLKKQARYTEFQNDVAKNTTFGRGQVGFLKGALPYNTKKAMELQYGEDAEKILDTKSAKVGEMVGIATQFTAPYVLAAPKIGKAVTTIPKIAKMGKLGQTVAKSVATDLSVGLPLNVNYAYNKEDLSGKEALKSIGVNTALDVGLGAGIEGISHIIGKTLKSGKKIRNVEDLKNLTPIEEKEIMTITKAIPQAPKQAIQPQNLRLGTKLSQAEKTIPNLPYNPFAKQQPQKNVNQFKDLGADVNRFEEKAMALTNSEVLKPTKREILSDITANAKRKFVDAGDTVAKISKINNDDGLYSLYNNARNARKRADHHIGKMQTDINGDPVGKSLKAIFEPIRKRGDNYYEDFQEYMYHLHNVDRMAQNKPVFGDFVTADESQLVAESLLKQHPEFAEHAQEVRGYLDNLMRYRVDAGLVSEDSANIMAEMYKNYVPTYRANPSARGINVFGNTARVNQGIKRAIGSNKDLLPLHEQISKQTMQTIDASHKNLFGARLVENINPKTSQYIQELKKIDDAFDVDKDALPELKNAFTVYDKGTPYQMSVDSGLYEGIKALSGKDPDKIIELATKGNTAFKELITSWNPMFLIRNFARDTQDVGLYSKDLSKFVKMYPGAVKEITTNGKMWQKYQALGGAGNSFFDYANGYKKDPSWLRKNTLDRMESLNMATEQLPRFTEFLATLEKLGHEPSYDELMQAMYNSADVTVNFGRSGTWGKTLNSTFVPFFNPAIQGTSKLIRRFTEAKGSKEWTELVLKTAAFGVAPSLVNEMIYYSDPEYAKLQDGIKDTNFMFKLDDGEWLKIPKGRVLSLFGATAQRAYGDIKGEEDAYAGIVDTAKQQSAPINPFETNILSPFRLAKNNQTWYGGEIEPQRVANMRPSQRYTESTTGLSKKVVGAMGGVADKINFSPMKLDYILDAYSGIIGDVAIPLMTPKAETNPFKKAFVTDSVMQNRISNDFYNAKQEIIYNRNDETATLTDDVLNRYMNRVQGDLSDRYKEIREIQNGLGTDKYKREKARSIQQEVNEIELTALSKLKQVKEVSDRLLPNYNPNDDKALDNMTREVNKEVFGAEYALKTYDKNVYGKAQWAKENGIDYDTFYDTYFAAKANNEDGKGAIKRREAIEAMKEIGLTSEQRQRMIQALFKSQKELDRLPEQKNKAP